MLSSIIRAPHSGMPRYTRQAGTPLKGSAAANAASVQGASRMCQANTNRAGPSILTVGGSAVNGTPAAIPVIGSLAPSPIYHFLDSAPGDRAHHPRRSSTRTVDRAPDPRTPFSGPGTNRAVYPNVSFGAPSVLAV
jgi:hypothetical protein